MTVKEVIALAARARKKDCRAEAERICQILEVPIEKKIKDLSLGNRKKVSIVCALQHQPELLILDEPTSGLDPLMQERFFKLIKEACAAGATCFLSSHNLAEVKNYCDRAAIIREGQLSAILCSISLHACSRPFELVWGRQTRHYRFWLLPIILLSWCLHQQ